ncbi:hypothetical protein FDECE_3847 [Fusarium decemcellulare]|nr:hypothetical protein FDECE_3847 [Fusarium decemcellulare]
MGTTKSRNVALAASLALLRSGQSLIDPDQVQQIGDFFQLGSTKPSALGEGRAYQWNKNQVACLRRSRSHRCLMHMGWMTGHPEKETTWVIGVQFQESQLELHSCEAGDCFEDVEVKHGVASRSRALTDGFSVYDGILS